MATKLKIHKGDEVVVIAGKDRGKRGTVQEVHVDDAAVVVGGVNIRKRHTKPNPQKNVKGGIVEKPGPLGLGKVMLICPHCGEPTRVGYKIEDGEKDRVCKRCGEAIVTEKS
ncbi:MAG TPA: 50S ribosomal protein L24 [Candidatus Limnocylindria bacterium]|nr:50S ribosomal protein L24 [Candidatus Limnocylindria bacterium]